MTIKKPIKTERLLTEVELELMSILWRHEGGGTVNDVIAGLPPGRDLAYTSVSTILRILEQKKVVGTRKEGRGHIYYPLLAKNAYEATTLHHLVTTVFDNAPSTLVKRLIESEKLSKEEIQKIQALLNKRAK